MIALYCGSASDRHLLLGADIGRNFGGGVIDEVTEAVMRDAAEIGEVSLLMDGASTALGQPACCNGTGAGGKATA